MNLDWESIDIDRLPKHFQEIGTDLGIEVVRYLVETWGGSVLYVPTLSKLTSQYLDDLIRSEFDGTNERALAKKFGISRSRVRRVLK